VLRDSALHDQDRDPVKLRRYLTAVAANTAGVVEHKTVFDAARITRLTGVAYDGLLEMLFVAEQIPAWHSNRLNRLTRSPKRYLTEPALLGPLLGVDERGALRNGDILGRLLDSFVVSQLRPEIEVAAAQPRLHHIRQEGGSHEIDLVAEYPGGKLVAIEVKASSAPKAADARHLVWLRDHIGDDFVAGIVFHTGPRVIPIGDRVSALPISCLWGGAQCTR
jgi:predicted AAA+ superfamily ATPase